VCEQQNHQWIVPEKIHSHPTEEISAIQQGRGGKCFSDNSKCIQASEGVGGFNPKFPLWGQGYMHIFRNDPIVVHFLNKPGVLMSHWLVND
jgi:hypothetical protein